MNRIRGKQILISGASAGIGEACARNCAAQEADLILLARRKDRLDALKEEIETNYGVEVIIRRLDVRDRADVFAFGDEVDKSGRVPDVLINNAGLAAGLDKLQDGQFSDWDRMIDTNIKGLLNLSRTILPMMIKRDAGHVVNLGSIAGHQVYPGGNIYNATKFAVRALTEAMGVDLLGSNIRVSSVSPGLVETEFSAVRFDGDTSRAEQVYQGFSPLLANDIADAVSYIINAPAHVNIRDMIILPTDQRNAYCLHRSQ